MPGTMSFPTKVHFGPGCIARVPEEVRRLGRKRALVVADPGVVKAGLVARLGAVLNEAKIAWTLFDQVAPNPVEQNVLDGVAAFRAADADFLIGIGGGSPLDVAKAIRLMAAHPPPLAQYDDARGGYERIHGELAPFLAIATTAGTGSEVGRSAVIVLAETGRKAVIFSPHLLAEVAFLDPELTVGLPPFITAATGFDALTHGIESYLATGDHPFADAMALHCIRYCAEFLPRAVADGGDLVAREKMLLASSMGAVAFQKGLGAAHSLAHALSPVAGTHHGLANALVLPEVLAFNLPQTADKLREIAILLGAGPGARAEDCVERVRALRRQVGLPERLRDAGVREEQLERMLPIAVEDGCHQTNPRKVTREDFARLLQAAF